MFDLYLFTLHQQAGKFQPELPGLLAATAPRKCARARSDDKLMVLITFTSANRLPQPKLDELLQKMQNTYFTSSGSVTAGLRTIAEQVNELFVEHNLHTGQSDHLLAALNLAVIKNDSVYLAHVGSTHSLVLEQNQVQDLCDEYGNGGRGLGISRTVNVRYFNAQVKAGDALLLCAEPPMHWNPRSLVGTPQLNLESLRRRLLNQAAPELMAAVVRFQEGKGLLHRLRVRTTATPAEVVSGAPRATTVSAVSQGVPVDAQPAVPQGEPESITPITMPEVSTAVSVPAPGEIEDDERIPIAEEAVAAPRQTVAPPPAPRAIPPAPRQPVRLHSRPVEAKGSSFTQKLANFFLGANRGKQRFSEGVRNVTSRVLPGRVAQPPTLSPAMMVFLAVAVPLVVVAIAVTVYMKNGLEERHKLYLSEAQLAYDRAAAQVDPALKRLEYQTALDQLDKAESYGASDISKGLRDQVQDAVDNLDGVKRLTLLPALKPGMSTTVEITRMVASDKDVYLLDASENRILRLKLLGGQEYRYEFDGGFVCPTLPGKLVDLVLIGFKTNLNATVMGVNEKGDIMYCSAQAGGEASMGELAQPDSGFSRITGIEEFQDTLFVLDTGAETSMVWRYLKDPDGMWGAPEPVFGKNKPYLDDVVDLAVYENYLYLLHADGKFTKCEADDYGSAETTCDENIAFEDLSSDTVQRTFDFPLAKFLQVTAAEQPGPGVYFLETNGPTVLQFGVTMKTLYWQLRPRPSTEYTQPDKPLTAFAITQQLPRYILLAYTNQLYFGAIDQ
jgi:hypothetical protein